MVGHDYFKLPLVTSFYSDQRSILSMLNDNQMTLSGDDLSADPNKNAYDEICSKVKDDTGLHRKVTVKSLLDFFSRKPYGWRDLDILGMIGTLWKHHKLQVYIHDNEVDARNSSFKNDLARKNNTDTMVIRLQEKIDEQILYSVKRIMNNTYSENLPMEETKLKEGVIDFFTRKRDFLGKIRQRYGSSYAGSTVAAEIYQDFDAILRSSDTLSIFNEIIARKDSLEDNAETLEQLEAFYKDGSNQQRNYQDGKKICEWYAQNRSLQDLSKLEPIVAKMNEIIAMDMPFTRMNDLANLVFQASTVKAEIIKAKLERIKKRIETDQDTVSKELSEALKAELTDDQKDRLQAKADQIANQYQGWLNTLTVDTPNMDSYVTASANTVNDFRRFITNVMNEGGEPSVRTKRVRIIDCVPTVNKKIASTDDVDRVVDAIRQKLLADLDEYDEIDLG